MSSTIDKFGRKRKAEDGEDGRGYSIINGNFNIEGRQFTNVGEPKHKQNLVTLDYFDRHRFDFENKPVLSIADPQAPTDGSNKRYVDNAVDEQALKPLVRQILGEELGRITLAYDAVGSTAASSEQELGVNLLKSIVGQEIDKIRCGTIMQFSAQQESDKVFYRINNHSVYLGMIMECKVIFAWINREGCMVQISSLDANKELKTDSVIPFEQLTGRKMSGSTVIQLRLIENVSALAGTLVFEYKPWREGDVLQLTNQFIFWKS